MEVIIYPNDDNTVSVIYPSPNSPLTMEERAAKFVPNGKPYEIVDDSTLPLDKPSELWEWI